MKYKMQILLLGMLMYKAGFTQNGTWKQMGPPLSGRVTGIVASPANPDLLIAASGGGGIWRSINGGQSWTQSASQVLPDNTVLKLEWDKLNNGRLYAITYSDLYASTDAGISWKNLTGSGGMPSLPLPANFLDPAPFAQLLYPAGGRTIFWSKPGSGIFYSNDGIIFKQHYPFPGAAGNQDNFIGSITADDATGRIYFAPMQTSTTAMAKLFRSSCSWMPGKPCLSWEPANTGLPQQSAVSNIVWCKSADRLLLSVISGPSSKSYFYTSIDGKNWNPCPNQPVMGIYPIRLLAISANLIIAGGVNIVATSDFGKSWSSIYFPNLHPDIRSLYYASYPTGGFLWAGTDGVSSGAYYAMARWKCDGLNIPSQPVKVSATGIVSWHSYYVNLLHLKGNQTTRRVFTGAQDNGNMATDDGGGSWNILYQKDGCGDKIALAIAPSNPDIAYGVSCDGAVISKTVNAASAPSPKEIAWNVLSVPAAPYGFHWTHATIAINPADANKVCMASVFGKILISSTGGSTWYTSVLPDNAKPVCVWMVKYLSILTGTSEHGIYRSTDQGITWKPFGLNSGFGGAVLKVIYSTASGGSFFAATSKGLYRRLPGAGDFQLLPGAVGAGHAVSDVEADPLCPSRIYISLGAWHHKLYHRGGVLISQDNGNSFKSITAGLLLHQVPVSDIVIDPVQPRYLYVATYGTGIWKYDAGVLPACQ